MSTLSGGSQDSLGWVNRGQPGTPPLNWGWVYPAQPGVPPVVVILPVPVIDPASGSVPVDVTITTEDGLQIIYTIDDTAPGLTNGTVTSSPAAIHFGTPLTLRAVATNLIDISAEVTATYDPGPVVVITPESGEVPMNVVLTSAETTDLIYTVDGTVPTLSNGTQVTSPVTLNLLEPCTVRAVATDGVDVFSVSSGEYVYTGREGDPRLVPGLIAWYRSDSVEVTGGVVSTWWDQSGNAIHATPNGSGLPAGGVGPTLVSNVLNGFPALRFNGTTSFLITDYQNFDPPNMFFLVAKQTSKTPFAQFLMSYGDNYFRLGCNTSGYYYMRDDYTESDPDEFLLNDSTDHSGAFHLFGAGLGSIPIGITSKGWVDGVEVFTGDTPSTTPAILEFGRDSNVENYLIGDIVEFIRYYGNSAGANIYTISVSDRKWLEAYLANRYDLPNAVPFSPGPLNISGLVAWFKADTLALSDDAEIASWTDSSGNGFTATKGTTGPAFKTNILNGYPVARFAADKWLTATDLHCAQPCTVFFVSKGASGATGSIIADHGGGYYMNITNRAAPTGLYVHANYAINDGVDHTGAFHVFSISLAGATTKGYVDGVLTLTGNPGPAGIDELAIGAWNHIGELASFTGDIAEIIIFRRPLTDHERNEIEAYLAIKYAL